MSSSRNIAARAGRWSACHRRLAVLGWLAFAFLAFMVGSNIGTDTLTDDEAAVGESGTAARISAEAYPKKIDESVLVQSKTLEADSPAFRAAVADVTRRLEQTDGLEQIHGPHDRSAPAPISEDAARRS